MYDQIDFGIFKIDSYSLMIFIGLCFFVWYFIYILEKKNSYTHEEVNKLLVFLAIGLGGALLSSLLFDFIVHKIKNPETAKFGGLTFLGGLIGGIIIFSLLIYIFMIDKRKQILKILNLIIPGVVVAHAFGRIGCFLSGCCFGVETSSSFGVVFPGETVKRHPTQLYEALFLFLFFVIFIVLKNKKINKNFLSIYFIGYGVFRFLVEFIRGDNRGSTIFNILSPSQLISVLLIVSGVIICIYQKKKGANNESLL